MIRIQEKLSLQAATMLIIAALVVGVVCGYAWSKGEFRRHSQATCKDWGNGYMMCPIDVAN